MKDLTFLMFTFIVILGALFIASTNTPTGRVVFGTENIQTININETYTENTTLDVNLINITKISITGNLIAQNNTKAKVYAKTSTGATLQIAEIIIEESSGTTSTFTARVTGQSSTINESLEEEQEQEENIDEVTDEVTEEITEDNIEDEEGFEQEELAENVSDSFDENLTYEEQELEIVIENNTEEIQNETQNETQPDEEHIIEEETQEELEESLEQDNNDEQEDTENSYENETLLIKEFSDLCHQTCALPELTNITQIIIEVNEGELYLEKLNIAQITKTLGDGIKKEVEDIQILIGENKTLKADEYFEGEDLYYDAKSSEGYTYIVNNNEITFIAQKPGDWESLLYATEGNTLIVSNKFNIIINDDGTSPINETDYEDDETTDIDENETTIPDDEIDTSLNETIIGNETIQINQTIIENETITDNTTTIENETITEDLGCDHPDPNQRPLECIQGENTTYFQPENLLVENKRAEIVGKFTPIGNLLITGDIVENTNEQPKEHDYQLGHSNNIGEFVPTIWINTETGNLHLKGTLIEANSNLVYELGKYAIANKRGILLAVVDRQTGDMTLRGNVVPYRRSLE